MIKGICLRYCKNEPEAEDLVQDTFIRVFDKLNTYSGKGALGAWLRRIAINVAIERYQKNKNKGVLIELNDYSNAISDSAIENLELEDLLKKIQRLPHGFRTVFNLYAVEGYNHREIGELLGISDGTSKSQYSRARVLLREMITKDDITNNKKINYA